MNCHDRRFLGAARAGGRDVLRSAFDSAGQRCSALRVLFLQDDVAERMLDMLLGAVRELDDRRSARLRDRCRPGDRRRGARRARAHKARMRDEARDLLDLPLAGAVRARAPCRAGDLRDRRRLSCSRARCSGPILHVVAFAGDRLGRGRARRSTPPATASRLGCTPASKPPPTSWQARVKVGNLYVNRNQIGAVVGVQPFGGEGLPAPGPRPAARIICRALPLERVRTTDITASGGNAASARRGKR